MRACDSPANALRRFFSVSVPLIDAITLLDRVINFRGRIYEEGLPQASGKQRRNGKNNSCKVFLGDGEYTPMEKAYMNFRISSDAVYYTQAMPSGTYKASMNGDGKIIRDGRVTFICDSSVSNGIYYMSYGLERSYLYFCDEDGQESFVCQMKELNINSGVAVVDGYVYYNSGFERVLDQDSGYYINDYINAKPTATKLLSEKTADDSLS